MHQKREQRYLDRASDEHLRAVSEQARQIMVRKISSEIIDPERRAAAIFAACMDAIMSLTVDDDELSVDAL
jgi:hypothetical protein